MNAQQLYELLDDWSDTHSSPLNQFIVRVEVSDSYYDKNIEQSDIDVDIYNGQKYLIIHGD